MSVQEKILNYLSVYGKENRYKLSTILKIDAAEVTKALDQLEKEGTIEIKECKAMLAKGQEPIIETEQEDEISIQKAEVEEEPKETEVPEETSAEEDLKEEIEEEPTEISIEEERIEGFIIFYNANKGNGSITGDDGKTYGVFKDSLKEGVTVKSQDKVSFKAVKINEKWRAVEVELLNKF